MVGSFAFKLKSFRAIAGLSLAELAERAGISKTYLWELEKDEIGEKIPSVDVTKRLADALSIDLMDLVGETKQSAWPKRGGTKRIIEQKSGANMSDNDESEAKDKASLAGMTIRQLQELIADLADALHHLYDAQNGPPLLLPRHKTYWEEAMDKALKALRRAEPLLENNP